MDHDGISKKRATLIVPNQSTVKLGDEWIDRENDWRSIVSCPWFVIQNFFAVCAMVDLENRGWRILYAFNFFEWNGRWILSWRDEFFVVNFIVIVLIICLCYVILLY